MARPRTRSPPAVPEICAAQLRLPTDCEVCLAAVGSCSSSRASCHLRALFVSWCGDLTYMFAFKNPDFAQLQICLPSRTPAYLLLLETLFLISQIISIYTIGLQYMHDKDLSADATICQNLQSYIIKHLSTKQS